MPNNRRLTYAHLSFPAVCDSAPKNAVRFGSYLRSRCCLPPSHAGRGGAALAFMTWSIGLTATEADFSGNPVMGQFEIFSTVFDRRLKNVAKNRAANPPQ